MDEDGPHFVDGLKTAAKPVCYRVRMAAQNPGRFFDHIAPVNFDMAWITAAHAHLLHGRSDCASQERSKALNPLLAVISGHPLQLVRDAGAKPQFPQHGQAAACQS